MPLGLALIEKFFGLLIVITGALVFHYTRQITGLEGVGFSFFVFFGLVLIFLGIYLIIVKSVNGIEE